MPKKSICARRVLPTFAAFLLTVCWIDQGAARAQAAGDASDQAQGQDAISKHPASTTPEPAPGQSADERMRAQVQQALEASQAHFAEVKAKSDAEMAQRRQAQQDYETGVRAAAEAKARYEADMARYQGDVATHEADLARAHAADEDYRRQRQAYEAAYRKATGHAPPIDVGEADRGPSVAHKTDLF